MNVAAAILVIRLDAESGNGTPILNYRASQEVDLWCDEVVVKKVLRAGPGSLALGSREVNQIIRQHAKYYDERFGPGMAQAAANYRAWIRV